jgi:two-component system alkaline phosphatase synthesis response regulator PhoP
VPIDAAIILGRILESDRFVNKDLVSDRSSLLHPAPTAGQCAAKRILVANSDPLVCGLLVATLEDTGFQVKTARDGEAAWAELLASHYDLLVTEDIMPKASGLALVRRIRVAAMALSVIVASNRLDGDDFAKLNHGPWARFEAFVRKPFTTAELLTVVFRVLAMI